MKLKIRKHNGKTYRDSLSTFLARSLLSMSVRFRLSFSFIFCTDNRAEIHESGLTHEQLCYCCCCCCLQAVCNSCMILAADNDRRDAFHRQTAPPYLSSWRQRQCFRCILVAAMVASLHRRIRRNDSTYADLIMYSHCFQIC